MSASRATYSLGNFGGYGHGHAAVVSAPISSHGYGHAAIATAPVSTASYGHSAPLAIAAAHPVASVGYAGHGHGHAVVDKAVHYPPQPYKFGYDSVDDYGTKQSRHEVSDEHNNKKGSYSFSDAHGIQRHVEYVADAHGFRASIKTNEPGTAPSHPAAAHYDAQPVAVKHVATAPVATYAKAPIAYAHAAPVASYDHAASSYGH
ncbi:hypothetical protein BIW11_03862 [Tropilaelaps mercedesae]|uniref:Cuticle protein 16.8-like n=1 Tax=Tropilaelaps mercedesae TaxID=418985 RepID=A0A1V9XEP6_9ACAR|nr:hypothetical protein BIW11_03862 [Tropilaelaps mercedesae]